MQHLSDLFDRNDDPLSGLLVPADQGFSDGSLIADTETDTIFVCDSCGSYLDIPGTCDTPRCNRAPTNTTLSRKEQNAS